MIPKSSKAISLLLEQNRGTSFSGVDSFFAGPLVNYSEQLIVDLQAMEGCTDVTSYEDLCAYTQLFNIGALIQYLLGDVRRAKLLAFSAIRLVLRIADAAKCPEWNVQIIQPVINVARIFRAIGKTEACVATLRDLRQIAGNGKAGFVLGFKVDTPTASRIRNFDTKARSVVIACDRTETLKCALANGDFRSVREKTVRDNSRPLGDLKEFELEHLLKCEFADRCYGRLLTIVEKLPHARAWVYLYVIDAFCEVGLLAEARETSTSLAERILGYGDDRTRDALLYALALRLAFLQEFSSSEKIAARALDISRDLRNEVIQLRIATLLAILGNDEQSEAGSTREAQVWELMRKSRHNCERLNSCAALVQAEIEPQKYVKAATELENLVSSELTTITPAIRQLREFTDVNQAPALNRRASSLEVRLVEADWIYRELTQLSKTAYFVSNSIGLALSS